MATIDERRVALQTTRDAEVVWLSQIAGWPYHRIATHFGMITQRVHQVMDAHRRAQRSAG